MSESTNVILEASGLYKSYHDDQMRVDVLHHIDMTIHAGERCAIVGASGSGKSTLLHLLGGLDTPTTGKVSLLGNDYSTLNEAERGRLRNRHLGFVYQFHHLLPEFSVLDNVAMPLYVGRMANSCAQAQAKEMIDAVGLSHRLHHKPSELSGGERQRTAIARALVTRPSCLLADEPTGNLDSATADKIYELLVALQQHNQMALLIVTHDTQLAGRMDRVLHMKDGMFVK